MRAPTRIAAVIVALTALMAAGCSAASGPAASAPPRAAVTSASPGDSAAGEGPVPTFVPRYYVAIDPANAGHLIVRATVTGAVVATVDAPHGTRAAGVYGSGNGQAFAVATMPVVANPGGGQQWYLLRLRSGVPAPLRHLSVGRDVGPGPTAIALSPDGSKIAMAYTYRSYPPNPQPLVLYSTTTGAVLRTWTVKSGIISAADPMANGDLGQEAGAISMRWTANGRGLAFAFHATVHAGKPGYRYNRAASIRLLDTTAPGSDLVAGSRELASAEPQYNPGNGVGTRCLAGSGWSVASDGQAITCAAEWGTPGVSLPPGMRPTGCAGRPATSPAMRQQVNLGFWRLYSLPGGGGAETIYGACTAGDIHLAWASPDGKLVLGALGTPGHSMFGLFSAGQFHELPPPPAGIPLDSIAW